MSLVVVLTALPARLVAVPYSALAPHWLVAGNLLAGSLAGAWAGASWATRMRTATLHKVLAALLVLMAAALVFTHLDDSVSALGPAPAPPAGRAPCGDRPAGRTPRASAGGPHWHRPEAAPPGAALKQVGKI